MLELMRKRRSIRKYRDIPIEQEKLDSIMECALRSPSSKHRRPWTVWAVTDIELKKKLAVSKPGGVLFMDKAPVIYVVAGYPDVSECWIEDCSIVSTVIQLEAESLGLGSCWGQIRGRDYNDNVTSSEYIKELLKMDDDCEVLCIISVGYAAEEVEGRMDVPYSKSKSI
ncbi:MAG TPA: nitroreductase family protein [Clostridia bacterium]|nr:nitroreductase family protein [Clostridia bacterium]